MPLYELLQPVRMLGAEYQKGARVTLGPGAGELLVKTGQAGQVIGGKVKRPPGRPRKKAAAKGAKGAK